MAGCNGNESVSQKMVNVPGIGDVLEDLHINHNSMDYDERQRLVTHNESLVDTVCNTNAFLRFISGRSIFDPTDDTYITCTASAEQVTCKIRVDAEISNPLFWQGDVTTTLTYQTETQQWSAVPIITEEQNGQSVTREYKACVPSFVIEALIANLECYLKSSESEGLENEANRLTISLYVNSLRNQQNAIVEKMPRYLKNDCELADPSRQDDSLSLPPPPIGDL